MNDWLLRLFEGTGASPALVETVLLVSLLAFLSGQFMAWVYMWTHQGLSYSQTFVGSLVVLPVIVALMMLLMRGSIVVAFGLLAVFAVVRFRNVLKDTRDTTFVLWAITVGLGFGTLRFGVALVGVLSVAVVLLYLRLTSFGNRHRYDAVLNLQLTGDLASGLRTLNELLGRYCQRSFLARERRLTDEGLDLTYRLLLRDPSRDEEFRWALSQTSGFEHVSLFMREDESEV